MQDRPTASELLATVAAYLEDELLPALDGPLAYRTRVAANLARILEREATLAPAALERECDALCGLLGIDRGALGEGATPAHVAQLNARTARAIAAGHVTHEDAWPVVMDITRAKLAIVRPGYDAYDARTELPPSEPRA